MDWLREILRDAEGPDEVLLSREGRIPGGWSPRKMIVIPYTVPQSWMEEVISRAIFRQSVIVQVNPSQFDNLASEFSDLVIPDFKHP